MNRPAASRILVLDDPRLRKLLAKYLSVNGLRVEKVADGEGMPSALGRDIRTSSCST